MRQGQLKPGILDGSIRTALVALAGILLLAAPSAARQQDLAEEEMGGELSDDVSRSDLLKYATSLDPPTRAFPRAFEFPRHVTQEGVFGIDVSHHQGEIDWTKIASGKVTFVYVKATQGARSFDPRFKSNWAAIEASGAEHKRPYRGAYHFMSANIDAAAQASNYLARVGSVRATDLPPCLDLEWDFARKDGKYVTGPDGKPVDRWSAYTPAQIIAKAKIWLDAVEKATGKRPIIYTNRYWWQERIGKDLSLSKYHLWISDYTNFSLRQETPRTPEKHDWKVWQLSDKGRISVGGISGPVDTNVFQGTRADFLAWCCSDAPR